MRDYQFDRANFLHSSGQHFEAIDLLKELLGNDPNDAFYHGLLASCLLATRRLHAAEYEIGVALALEPQLPFLLLVKGRVEIFKNRPKQALALCDEALAIDPESVDALVLKADINHILGHSAERLACIQQALTLAPDSADVLSSLGDYYHSTGELEKAKAVATDALAISPESEDANLLMGKIQLDLGDIEDAEYHAKFVILQNPNSDEALTLFANIKARKNWFLGLWWRFNSKVSKFGNLKASMVLISGYLLFTLLSQVLSDLGYENASTVTTFAWLGLVIYSWVGIPYYYKTLNKELEKFQFNRDY